MAGTQQVQIMETIRAMKLAMKRKADGIMANVRQWLMSHD